MIAKIKLLLTNRFAKHASAFGLILILNFVIYFLNIGDFFVSDDFDWINLTQKTQNVWGVLTGNYYGIHAAGGTFRPMVNLIFYIEHLLFGVNPVGYHVVSILLNVGCAIMVYLIALKLFSEKNFKFYIALFSAFAFSLMPNHVEAVVWVAAVADPLATLLHLASFYFYITARNYKLQITNFKQIINDKLQIKNSESTFRLRPFSFILSLIFFILALLTKEIAITLPFLILGYELIFRKPTALQPNALIHKLSQFFRFSKSKLIVLSSYFLLLSSYFLILAAYLIYRYWAISLAFGYYGRSSLSVVAHVNGYVKTFINFGVNNIFYGDWRIAVASLVIKHWPVLAFIFTLVIVWVLFNLIKNKYQNITFLIFFWLLNILLVLPLSLGLHGDEGERYGYLPSVAVAILIGAGLIMIWERQRIIFVIVSAIIFLYFIYNQQLQAQYWTKSSLISRSLYYQLPSFDYQDYQRTYVIGLPDNYHGAQVMRNGFVQALSLRKLADSTKVERVPAYTVVTDQNFGKPLFSTITLKDKGFLMTTVDKRFDVTGDAAVTYPDYMFELRGYDYGRILANHIWFRLLGDKADEFKEGKVQVLYYDEGRLKEVNYE